MAVTLSGLSPKEALERRAEIITQAQNKAEERADDWSSEDQAAFDEAMTDAAKLADHAKRTAAIEKSLQFSMELPESGGSPSNKNRPQNDPSLNPNANHVKDQPLMISVRDGYNSDGSIRYAQIPVAQRGSAEYRDGFKHYLKTGKAQAGLHLAPDSQSGITRSMALQSDAAEQAGYLVASEQFAAGILKEVDDLLFIRKHARVHTVVEASSLGIRTRTNRAQTFGWSQELNISDEDDSLRYGKRVLTPHHLTGSIKLSRDLLRRSVVSAEGEVRTELGRDGAEAMEDAYLLGDGAQKPLGVFTPSDNGISTARDVNTGAAATFTTDGLINAKYSLKSQYRTGARGPLRWLFHRNSINKIALLKDTTGQPIFRVGMGRAQDTGLPEDEIFGIPVDESERVPNTFVSGQYVGLLCNWRYFEIADALDMEIQVLYELNARSNQVEYIARLKTDGMPTLEEAFTRLKLGT
jgi:HK97 family phage major capsid protein